MYLLRATVSNYPLGRDAGGQGPALYAQPHVSAFRTPSARSRVEMPYPSCPRGQKRFPRGCDHPPGGPTVDQDRAATRAHVNIRPRLHTNYRASPPPCALPGPAIHAARDGHRHGPVRPGPAGPGLRRRREALALPFRLNQAGPQRTGKGPGPRRLGEAARGGRIPAGQRQGVRTMRQAVGGE